MLRLISCENRATMQAYRDGHTLEEYLDEMWRRRATEHPGSDKSAGKWPCLVYSKPENSNVHSISKRVRGK